MSYVGNPFEFDIFLSYSHGDVDNSGNSILRQWSNGFARELERELQSLPNLGREIRIFLDQHRRPGQGIDPMAPLTEQLKIEITGSAILLVLMSPHYLKSDWCRDERDWWCQSQTEHPLLGDDRIAVARIWPTTERWPAALADQCGEPFVGFSFHEKSRPELHPQPFEWPEPHSGSRAPFRDVLLNLVGWLNIKLGAIRAVLDERKRKMDEAARLAAGGGQVIYLHGRAEQEREWAKIGDRLAKNGLVVLPGEPDRVESDPQRAEKIRNARVETLSGCDALLLLASEEGRAVDADLVVVGRQDRQSARARSHRLLPCALLDSVGPPIATPRRRSAARGLQVDWIDATGESWPQEVQQWLVQAGSVAGAI